MRGIVRGIYASAKRFYVECSDGTYAPFSITRGGMPYGGEFVRWENGDSPIEMVMGESSGTMMVDQARVGLTLDEARALIAES